MRIGAFAQEAGLTTRQVRYWSVQGLLPESRTSNGYRDFSRREIPRARRINDMIAAGLTIAQIRRLAACLDYEQGVCARERRELELKAREIEGQIARLRSTRTIIIETLRNAPRIDENRRSTPRGTPEIATEGYTVNSSADSSADSSAGTTPKAKKDAADS